MATAGILVVVRGSVSLSREELESPVDSGPVVMVAVDAIRIAGSPRIAGENPQHIRALAELPDELPPITVHRQTMRVIDGVHRLRAAMIRQQHEIAVRFFDGTESDAFVLAVKANVAHGLPLCRADRKAAAVRIIASHPAWSDRMIASMTGLSARTIAEVRRRDPGPAPPPDGRIGQDGRIRPVDRLEKRRLASNLMLDNPHLSLRQVARAAGISPETARAVRARLRCGEGAVAPKRMVVADAEDIEIPDWPTVVARLRSDPTLRFTETGRTLLRLLDVHAMTGEKWATIVHNVPPHCRPTIAKVAMECARVWHTFAEQLAQQHPA